MGGVCAASRMARGRSAVASLLVCLCLLFVERHGQVVCEALDTAPRSALRVVNSSKEASSSLPTHAPPTGLNGQPRRRFPRPVPPSAAYRLFPPHHGCLAISDFVSCRAPGHALQLAYFLEEAPYVVAAFLPPDAGATSCITSSTLFGILDGFAASRTGNDGVALAAVVSEEAADRYNVQEWPTMMFFRGGRRDLYRGSLTSARAVENAITWRMRPIHENVQGGLAAAVGAVKRQLVAGARAVVIGRSADEAGPTAVGEVLRRVAGSFIDDHCGLHFVTWQGNEPSAGHAGISPAPLVSTSCTEEGHIAACLTSAPAEPLAWLSRDAPSWPACCLGMSAEPHLGKAGLARWVSSHQWPVLPELQPSTSEDILRPGYPLVILYLPVDGSDTACFEAENESACAASHREAVEARFSAQTSLMKKLSRAYSYGDPEECSDCRELVELGVESDCSATCERQLLFVWTAAESHPNITLRTSVSVELSDYAGCRRFALSAGRGQLHLVGERLQEYYAETLVPSYQCPPVHQERTVQEVVRKGGAGLAMGILARAVWSANRRRERASLLTLGAMLAAVAATANLVGGGLLVGNFVPKTGYETALVGGGLVASAVPIFIPFVASGIRQLVKAAAVALPAFATMFPEETSEALARAQCAAGFCCDGGA